MIDVQRDAQREMRGMVSPDYLAPADIDPETQGWEIHMPIPVFIDYQITTYARQPRHDRELLAQVLYERLPFRFGILEIPEDNTVRRLDVMSVSKRDITENAKRLFVNAISIRVSSEIPQVTLQTLYKALEVNVHTPDPARVGGTATRPQFTGVDFTISR